VHSGFVVANERQENATQGLVSHLAKTYWLLNAIEYPLSESHTVSAFDIVYLAK
jgi:hypothetical protein